MTTLAEHIIIAGAENRPPMLEKSMYDSWASHIRLFIKGKKNGRMMLDSIDEGPLVYPTVVGEVKHTRPKKYSELTEAEQLQDDCDETKDICDRVKLLMKGTELSYQERECRLYNLFDKFASVQGETLYEYYWRFSQLINDMHTIRMIMQQVQVNTKFMNTLPPEWSKFVTDVKLAKSLYTTNYDQLYPDTLALVANSQTLYNPSQSPQHSGEDPIDCINKAMAFLSVVTSRFPPSNNQLRTNRGIATTSRGNYAAGQAKVVKCYNCLGEGHMAKPCTQPKRPRNSACFKEKLMLAEAQEAGQILDAEQLAFIADPRIAKVQVAQQTIPQNLAFQTKDLDAYDSNCDDISSAKAVLMANLSSCDLDFLSKVPYSDTYLNDMINRDVQEIPYYEQTHIDDLPDNEITSDSNIIPYSQYLQESQDAVIHDTNSSAPNNLLVLSLVE
ncbi:copia protein [Tanacetum coccineum]